MSNARVVSDTEEISIETLLEKFHQGAIWYGQDEMNIGWPEELHISGSNLIRLLARLRDEYYDAIQDVKRALDSHNVPKPEGLSEADRIHLLVGRRMR